MVAPCIPILPYDHRAADWHAGERARLTALGKTPPFADGMMAAVARSHGLALVTMNPDDFRFFDLPCVDWRE